MKTIVLDRSDFSNPVHPYFWEDLLDQLFDESELPESRNDYPDSVELKVAKAELA